MAASSPETADATYVRRVRDGEQAAFRVLVERYEGMVYDLTHQYTESQAAAEDLAQDVFLKAFQKLDSLDDPSRFASWLYGIALNRCRDYAKNVRRETYAFSRTDTEADDITETLDRQDRQLEAEDETQRLWDALEALSPTYATPFLMKYRDGMTYKAMSDRLDVSVSALKVRVHRARKKLRALMDDRKDDTS
jgi:RNA polymerase sigma-70 factor (ECF subfamily)